MLIQLNAEVWMGILNWLLKYRKEMAEKFGEFGDRDFSQLTQTWLHQWTRNVKLGDLDITRNNLDQLALLNRTEIPRNFTDFSSIDLSYFDSEVLRFLGNIRGIFSNVNLATVGYEHLFLERAKTVLRQLLPLISGIEGLYIGYAIPEFIAYFRAEFPTQFQGARILHLLGLTTPEEFQDDISPWLLTKRDDGEPKMLFLFCCCDGDVAGIVQHIRQDFLNSHFTSNGYFVRICSRHLDNVPATTIQNERGEQFVVRVQVRGPRARQLLIARFSSNLGEYWLAQKFQELAAYNVNDQKRLIRIWSPEIGPIDEEASSSGSGNGQGDLKRNTPRARNAPTRFSPY